VSPPNAPFCYNKLPCTVVVCIYTYIYTYVYIYIYVCVYIYILDDSCRHMITLVLNTCSDKKEDLWKNMAWLEKTIYRDKAPRTAKRILFSLSVLLLLFSFPSLSLSLSLSLSAFFFNWIFHSRSIVHSCSLPLFLFPSFSFFFVSPRARGHGRANHRITASR